LLGLVPKQISTGYRTILGGICKITALYEGSGPDDLFELGRESGIIRQLEPADQMRAQA
jgi:hypothetical protein